MRKEQKKQPNQPEQDPTSSYTGFLSGLMGRREKFLNSEEGLHLRPLLELDDDEYEQHKANGTLQDVINRNSRPPDGVTRVPVEPERPKTFREKIREMFNPESAVGVACSVVKRTAPFTRDESLLDMHPMTAPIAASNRAASNLGAAYCNMREQRGDTTNMDKVVHFVSHCESARDKNRGYDAATITDFLSKETLLDMAPKVVSRRLAGQSVLPPVLDSVLDTVANVRGHMTPRDKDCLTEAMKQYPTTKSRAEMEKVVAPVTHRRSGRWGRTSDE